MYSRGSKGSSIHRNPYSSNLRISRMACSRSPGALDAAVQHDPGIGAHRLRRRRMNSMSRLASKPRRVIPALPNPIFNPPVTVFLHPPAVFIDLLVHGQKGVGAGNGRQRLPGRRRPAS